MLLNNHCHSRADGNPLRSAAWIHPSGTSPAYAGMTLSKVKKNLLMFSPFYKFKISGDSMLPTFKSGDTVVVNRLAYLFSNPKIGDIVACKDPRDGKTLIKRI